MERAGKEAVRWSDDIGEFIFILYYPLIALHYHVTFKIYIYSEAELRGYLCLTG